MSLSPNILNALGKSYANELSICRYGYLCSSKETLASLLQAVRKARALALLFDRVEVLHTDNYKVHGKQTNQFPKSTRLTHCGAGIEYFGFHQKQEIKPQKSASCQRHHQFGISSLFYWLAVRIRPSQNTAKQTAVIVAAVS